MIPHYILWITGWMKKIWKNAEEVITEKLTQQHKHSAFTPLDTSQLSTEEKRIISNCSYFFDAKQDETFKARICSYEKEQR